MDGKYGHKCLCEVSLGLRSVAYWQSFRRFSKIWSQQGQEHVRRAWNAFRVQNSPGVSRLRTIPWDSCYLYPGPGLTQPSILSESANEYRLRLGSFKAGMCDAAWCASCTRAPLWWHCLLWGTITNHRLITFYLLPWPSRPETIR